MAPILSESGLPDEEMYKFVRDGNRIAWDGYKSKHKDIAKEHNIGDEIGGQHDFVRRLVGDAGWLFVDGETYIVKGYSSSTKLRGDAVEAREQTVKILEQTVGKKVLDGGF